MKTFTFFLSGQVSGLTRTEALLSFLKAEEKVKEIARTQSLPKIGKLNEDTKIIVINPLEFVPAGASNRIAMIMLLPLLCDCDLIACLDNSDFSEGSKVEQALAKYLGIPIIYLKEY